MNANDSNQQRPVLIEQTAKKYKLIRGIGILIMILAAIFGAANSDQLGTTEGLGTIFTAVGFVTGLLVFSIGTMLSWWHHG
ncbi:MAG TPA: hypothetical protein VM260_23820 [Pirellula sp.]|nr:hypothetical protein [Pirellula sp.]